MRDAEQKIIGPFNELVTMQSVPMQGPVRDDQLFLERDAWISVSEGRIQGIGPIRQLKKEFPDAKIEEIETPCVGLPGFIDGHTHMCWEGSRARDYTLRTAGVSYLEIAKAGGGILDTVKRTRKATTDALRQQLMKRCTRHLHDGVTTSEVKSGYGLTVQDELKMLRVINQVSEFHAIDLVPTCLAAHMPPPEFKENSRAYLDLILQEILPVVREENLSGRVDIFIEDSAFTVALAKPFLQKAKAMGFSLAVHVDQFSTGGSALACHLGAISADHLEASGDAEIAALARSQTFAVVLPGCSLGLGLQYAPARKLLDGGAALVIATDWNPGSAPMGDLLLQAAVLGAAEKLTTAETFAAITCRAAAALELKDRGIIAPGFIADLLAFPCNDFREILYHQGKLKPAKIWKKGVDIFSA